MSVSRRPQQNQSAIGLFLVRQLNHSSECHDNVAAINAQEPSSEDGVGGRELLVVAWFERVDVGKILRPTGRLFVPQERVAAKDPPGI